jgi:hypothetical protein
MAQTVPMEIQLEGPAMMPPPGVQPNFVNPTNMKTEGRILVVFCLIASTLVVSMRMWTKTRLVRKVVLEDCSSLPSAEAFGMSFTDLVQGCVV